MNTKSKLVFGDEFTYSKVTDNFDYTGVKIKNFDKTSGGVIKQVTFFIYILSLVSVVFFLLSK